jgi:hypothetical protein
MKKWFAYLLLLACVLTHAQNMENQSSVDINYFKGNVALHKNEILHLIGGHPNGLIVSWNKKTFGNESWEHQYNYPDYGLSFSHQNFNNDVLGKIYALHAHYNFYFFKRNVMLRIGNGLAYNTNPYHKINNHKNIAFGSRILSSTFLLLNYKKERVFDKIGFQSGLTFTHYSNANVKSPNTGINSVTFNLGLTYDFNDDELEYTIAEPKKQFSQPIKYNIVFRSGLNESDIIGSGQYPFYILSAYADKRISYKSALQFGVDIFFSNFLKEYIKYNAIAFPGRNEDGKADYKRIGLFVGHELFISKTSIVTQFGYYAYLPYNFEGRTYIRAGLKRYFSKKWFGAITVKAHGASAEAVELGIGVRL